MSRESELEAWIADRPEVIESMARKYPPWHRYRNIKTDQTGYLVSYEEDETVSMVYDGHVDEMLDKLNEMLPMGVFGIKLEDIEPIADTH